MYFTSAVMPCIFFVLKFNDFRFTISQSLFFTIFVSLLLYYLRSDYYIYSFYDVDYYIVNCFVCVLIFSISSGLSYCCYRAIRQRLQGIKAD